MTARRRRSASANALVALGVGHDQGELLAADARGGIDLGACARAQQTCHALKREVADLVAEAVVDVLEVVEVADEHPHRGARAPGPFELEVEQLAKARGGWRAWSGGRCGRRRRGRAIRSSMRARMTMITMAPTSKVPMPTSHHAGMASEWGLGGEEGAIGQADEDDLGGGLPVGEEVGGVEEHPQIEEHERTGHFPREVGHAGDQRAAPGKRALAGSRPGDWRPGCRAPRRRQVGAGDDREQAQLVGGRWVGQDHGERGQGWRPRRTGSAAPWRRGSPGGWRLRMSHPIYRHGRPPARARTSPSGIDRP